VTAPHGPLPENPSGSQAQSEAPGLDRLANPGEIQPWESQRIWKKHGKKEIV